MKFLSIPVFILSLSFGLLIVYLFNPDPKVIYVYPTPDTVDKVQYKDHNDTCHKFTAQEVACGDNYESVTPQ